MRVLAADTTAREASVALIEREPSARAQREPSESRSERVGSLEPIGRRGWGPVAWEDGAPRTDDVTVRARREIREPYAHAQNLLPTIDLLLGEEGLSLDDVDGFAVAAGPGSFTGLRIGIATIEGLAFATGRPAVGVSTLEATAHRYRNAARIVAPFIDARRGEIYGALFRARHGELETVLEAICEPAERFLERLDGLAGEAPIVLAGSGVTLHRDLIERKCGSRMELRDSPPFLAEDVGRVGLKRLEAGRATPLGGLRALYLRPSDAEKKATAHPSNG